MSAKTKWRVTQHSSVRGYVTEADFRFKWVAQIVAWIFTGGLPGQGETYTTKIRKVPQS